MALLFSRRLTVGMVLVLAAAGLARAQSSALSGSSASVADRRILVMLRMAPPHFRPGSSYGGNYGDGEGRSARWRAARRLAAEQGLSIVDEWPMPLLGVDCFVMNVPPAQSLEAAAARVARDRAVSWAEPMHTYRGQAEGLGYNDPLYPLQPAAREWHLAELHRISTGRNVRVAVIDSMIDANQPDLAGQIETMRNFVPDRSSVPEDHGTGIAGIIVARPNNGVGIVGIAPQARLMGLRACWEERGAPGAPTICDSLSLAKALEFGIEHRAQIINMSLSGPDDLLLARLLDVALARDIIIVAAYDRSAAGGGFPASHKGVIAVVDEAPGPSIPGVVSAPGRDVPTTEPGARWSLVSGSSYAAAHVSGLFALLLERTALVHPGSALVFTTTGHAVDACATLLQDPEPCVGGRLHEALLSIAHK
ncbi:MAG: S8 family serine peptidase [Steroidobacteraceae bacterium]